MRKVWWGTRPLNFGDVLTKQLFEHFNIPFVKVKEKEDADTLCIGSVVRLANSGSMVLGSGCIHDNESLDRTVEYRFVRGPKTRDQVIKCGGECPEIYGDAALLLPDFVPAKEKTHKIGIVPHYQDYEQVMQSYGKTDKVINVVGDPIRVAEEISSCEKIISTSLHGIIAAHAYDIPAAQFTRSKLWGSGIKFKDYAASVGTSTITSTVENPIYTLPEPGVIDNIRNNIRPILESLA